jgi:hypothetical protein
MMPLDEAVAAVDRLLVHRARGGLWRRLGYAGRIR